MEATPPVPERPLLLLDYDGTLAPIVTDPAEAYPYPGIPALLSRLSALHPLVVISGRDLGTLGTLLTDGDGAPLRVRAVGLHGAEEATLGEAAERPAVEAHAAALRSLRESVPAGDGIVVEPKGGEAFAVHYRRAPDEAAARELLADWAGAAPAALEAVWGKRVVELRPHGVSKGVAVTDLARAHADRTPVYIGDDVTDEDAFKALADERPDSVTVRVGDGPTAARYTLADVPAVVAYLQRFDR